MPCFPRNFFEGKEKEKKEERRKKPRFQNHCKLFLVDELLLSRDLYSITIFKTLTTYRTTEEPIACGFHDS